MEKNILHVSNLDIVDGTPLLDIKPFVPEFDCRNEGKIGWLERSIHKFMTSKEEEGPFNEYFKALLMR